MGVTRIFGARARIPIISAWKLSATVRSMFLLYSQWQSDAWTRRCLGIRAGLRTQSGPLAMTHVRWIHGQSGRDSTDCTLMWTHFVGGWKVGPIDMCSWCDVSESGSRVPFIGEDDQRAMTATVVVSRQDPQDTCAQLIFGCKTTFVLQDEAGHVLSPDKDVTPTYSKSHWRAEFTSSSSGSRLGLEQIGRGS